MKPDRPARPVWSVLFILCLLGVVGLGGCDLEALAPTPTATDTPFILPASVTVNPIVPTVEVPDDEGDLDGVFGTRIAVFTAAAPEVIGINRFTVTPPPLPTLSNVPLQFVMSDGQIIRGGLFASTQRPAPIVLLAHEPDGGSADWTVLIPPLHAAGVSVVVVDLRGHGESGGNFNSTKLTTDLRLVIERIAVLPGVDRARVSIGGMGQSANAALVACASTEMCRSAFLISPVLDAFEVTSGEVISSYGGRPLFIAAARDDVSGFALLELLTREVRGAVRQVSFPGSSRGAVLLLEQPTLIEILIVWLKG